MSSPAARAAAFLAFDFGSDERWVKLEKSIEIPADIEEEAKKVRIRIR
jgi:hypothetical protein